MEQITVTISEVEQGDTTLPCHFYPAETCDYVNFTTSAGLNTGAVYIALYSLFGSVCNIDYSPGDGRGSFVTLDLPPRPGCYEYSIS